MFETTDGYWSRFARRRYSRRRLLGSAAVTGMGIASAAFVGCNAHSSGSSSKSSSGASGAGSSGNSVASLVGSTGSAPPSSEQPARGGTFVYVTGSNLQGLDPQNTSAAPTLTALGGIFSRPLKFRVDWDVNKANNRDVVPDLASSVESPDAVTWTLKLRTNARFHNIAPVNGHAVEAEDIKASYVRGLTAGSVAATGLTVMDASQIQTPDKNTVVIKLKYPFANFKNILASGQYSWIFPRELLAGAYDPKSKTIGSGPFLFDSYTPDVALNLKRNPDYFDQPRPYVDAVKVAIVPDPNQQYAQFAAGQIDTLSNISQQNLPTYQQQIPNAQTITNWGPGDAQLYYKPQDPKSPFRDIRVRRAVSLSFDRDALTKAAFDGKAIPNFYSPQSLGDWSLKMDQLPPDTAQWYKFDLNQASQLIRAAGLEGFELKYLSPSPYPAGGDSPSFHVLREATASMVGKLPWKVNLVLADSAREWINSGKGIRYGNFDPTACVWAGLEGHNDVDEYIFAWYSSQSTSDIGSVKDDQLDQGLIKGRSILNDDERLKHYIDLQKYMAAQLFSVGGNPNVLSFSMVNARVRNYQSGDGYGLIANNVAGLWLKK
jgi:peptide/nickel transport system substrate-binding protein